MSKKEHMYTQALVISGLIHQGGIQLAVSGVITGLVVGFLMQFIDRKLQ